MTTRISYLWVLAGLLVACHRPDSISEAPLIAKRPLAQSTLSVVSVGDILLADGSQKQLDAKGYPWAFEKVQPLIANADLLIGNLEGPITRSKDKFDKWKRWSYRMKAAATPALRSAGFDALCLANNHVMDFGTTGLRDTLEALRKADMMPFGAGMTEKEARRGVVFDFDSIRVGLLAFYDGGLERRSYYAAGDSPGTAEATQSGIRADIQRMRPYADVVIVTFHWGANYKPVSRAQRTLGHFAIEAGADIVNGHHPHIAQGLEVYQGKPILYSVGNFVFGTPGRYPKNEQGYGLVARFLFTGKTLGSVELEPIAVNNAIVGYQPTPAAPAEAKASLEPLLQEFGTEVSWDGSRAALMLPPGR